MSNQVIFPTKKSSIKSQQKLSVLHDDNHLLIVNKPPGVLVQGDKTGDKPLVEMAKDYLKEKYKKPGNVFLGVVHRLDRPTSGLIVFARTSKSLARLNDQFKTRTVKKTYWAIIERKSIAEKGTLENWLVRNSKQNKSYAHPKKVPNAKQASLDFFRFKTFDKYCCLSIDLHTGRHHQIRAQLSAAGYAIKGDLKYGAKRSNSDGSIHLHARSLELIHPTKKEKISLVAPPPNDPLWNLCVDGY